MSKNGAVLKATGHTTAVQTQSGAGMAQRRWRAFVCDCRVQVSPFSTLIPYDEIQGNRGLLILVEK